MGIVRIVQFVAGTVLTIQESRSFRFPFNYQNV